MICRGKLSPPAIDTGCRDLLSRLGDVLPAERGALGLPRRMGDDGSEVRVVRHLETARCACSAGPEHDAVRLGIAAGHAEREGMAAGACHLSVIALVVVFVVSPVRAGAQRLRQTREPARRKPT